MKTVQYLCFVALTAVCCSSLVHAWADDRGVAVTPGNVLASSGQRWALVVGINDYTSLPKLRFARQDAEAIAKTLVEKAGFAPENVVLMSDAAADFANKPTRGNLRNRINQLATMAGKDDLLLITFAGHGLNVDGQGYLVPMDGSQSDEGSLVPLSWVKTTLETSAAHQRLLILDACHSGARAGGESPAQALLAPLGGAAFLTLASCDSKQLSNEDEQLGQGVFTSSLINGLAGLADREAEGNKDGVVTAEELFHYASLSVKRWCLKTGKVQTPVLRGELRDRVELAWLSNSPASPVPRTVPQTLFRSDDRAIHNAASLDREPIPVSIQGFSQEVEDVLKFDLKAMGFSIVPASNAKFTIVGSCEPNLQGSATDLGSHQMRLNRAYSGSTLRRQAHAFADDLAQGLNNSKGIAQSRIAFVASTNSAQEVFICDFDGNNLQSVTKDGTTVSDPSWVAGQLVMYYSSHRLGKPDVFRHELTSGSRTAFALYPGVNISPAVSPDATRVAMICSKSGNPDVYVANADGSSLQQLTQTAEAEGAPCWSPDGQWVCFARASGNESALFKIRLADGQPHAIPISNARHATDPAWSPAGDHIAFTIRDNSGVSLIAVASYNGGDATVLCQGSDPSWAPNSETLIFTRSTAGQSQLCLVNITTKYSVVVKGLPNNCFQPNWAQ